MKQLTRMMALIALVIATLLPLHVSAASNSLGVNPRRDYSIKPGDKISDNLYVSNLSTTDDLTIKIEVIDFGPKNETGAPSLVLDSSKSTRWSLKPYVTIASTTKIAAGKSSNIPFTISIPANVGAGSYYSAIKYSTSGNGNDQNVSLTSSSATLMFVRVPGKTTDQLTLKSFGPFTPDASGDSGSFGKLYVGSAPKYVAYRLQNNGNVAEQPNGGIEIKNIFNKTVKTYDKANPNDSLVLIDQTRRFDLCLNQQKTSGTASDGRSIEQAQCNDSKLQPGRYTAKLELIYGDDGSVGSGGSSHELRSVATFWYLPFWFVAAVLIGLALIVGAIILIVRKLGASRHYQKRPNLKRFK